jgi:hypothetical protein
MPAKDATVAVLTALRTAMLADATITGVTTQIVDTPEANRAPPFIVIGQSVSDTFDTSETDGQDIAIDVAIYTKGPTTTGSRTVARRIREIFHRQPLTVTGHNCILVEVLTTIGPYQTDEEQLLQSIVTIRVLIGHG